jgi:hypothetical protein
MRHLSQTRTVTIGASIDVNRAWLIVRGSPGPNANIEVEIWNRGFLMIMKADAATSAHRWLGSSSCKKLIRGAEGADQNDIVQSRWEHT